MEEEKHSIGSESLAEGLSNDETNLRYKIISYSDQKMVVHLRRDQGDIVDKAKQDVKPESQESTSPASQVFDVKGDTHLNTPDQII